MSLIELSYITDALLEEAVAKVVFATKKHLRSGESLNHKNTVDPFSAIFDSMIQNISYSDWVNQERARQAQKTLQNAIGNFHQNVLGFVPGWENLKVGKGLDLRNDSRNIIAEVKNKHNTMNSSSALATYEKMQKQLDWDPSCKGYTAYCVIIIPHTKKALNTPFAPTEKGVSRQKREDIRIIDGKSFYELVTGQSDALAHLYNRLPIILAKVLKSSVKLTDIAEYLDLFKKVYSY